MLGIVVVLVFASSQDEAKEMAKKGVLPQVEECKACEARGEVVWPGNKATGGPDDFCYMWDDTYPFSWIPGTSPVSFSSYDDDWTAIPLPFTFDFYGKHYDTVWVGTNGWISFNDPGTSALSNYCMPNFTVAPGLMPYWDDLRFYGDNSQNTVWTATDGATYFVIEWRNVNQYGGDSLDPGSFEVVLFNTSDTTADSLVFQYLDAGISDEPNGQSATIAIAHGPVGSGGGDCFGGSGSSYQYYLEYSCNAASLSDGLAILFYKDPTCTPTDTTASDTNTATPIDEKILVLTWAPNSEDPKVWMSTDGGVSWTLRGIVDNIVASENDRTAHMSQSPIDHDVFAFLWGSDLTLRCYRSQDTGATWQLRGTIPSAGVGQGEPYLSSFVAGDDTIYLVTWTQDSLPKLYASGDDGATWTFVSYIPDSIGSESACEDVIAISGWTPDTLFVMAWHEDNGLTARDPNFYMSTDGGQTWTFLSVVDPSVNGWGDPAGDIMVDSAGTILTALWGADASSSSQCEIRLYRSTDFGQNWTYLGTQTVKWESSWMNNYLSYAITAHGNHYIATWRDNTADNQNFAVRPALIRSTDGGATWESLGEIPETAYDGGNRPPVSLVEFMSPTPVSIGTGEGVSPEAVDFSYQDGSLVVFSPKPMHVSLRLYDVSGRMVSSLYDDWVWGTRRFELPELPAGTYMAVLDADQFKLTRKLTIR